MRHVALYIHCASCYCLLIFTYNSISMGNETNLFTFLNHIRLAAFKQSDSHTDYIWDSYILRYKDVYICKCFSAFRRQTAHSSTQNHTSEELISQQHSCRNHKYRKAPLLYNAAFAAT